MHVEGGEGLFFMSPQDAKANLQGLKGADGVKVHNVVEVERVEIVQRCLPARLPALGVSIFSSVIFMRYYNARFGSLSCRLSTLLPR